MRRPASQSCVFCGSPCTVTRDHVPPKGLFSKPRPNNLITVPACEKCNGGSNLDDEFMQRLAMTRPAEWNEDAQQVGWNVVRSMNRPEAKGMRQGLHKTLAPVNLFTESGLYVGSGVRMRMDGERLNRIVSKVTRGMWWEMTKRKLVDEHQKKRLEEPNLPSLSEADMPRLPSNYKTFTHPVGSAPAHEDIRNTERNILILPRHVIGKGTFAYRYMIDETDPFVSVWGFSFYGAYHFMGYTVLDEGTESRLLAIREPPPEMPIGRW